MALQQFFVMVFCSMKPDLSQAQSQKMALSPQMREYLRLLHLPIPELRQAVDNVLEENPMLEEVRKSPEVAEILDVSRTFAYRMLKQGVIPSIRIGRTVRVRPQDLDTFIVSNVSGLPMEENPLSNQIISNPKV